MQAVALTSRSKALNMKALQSSWQAFDALAHLRPVTNEAEYDRMILLMNARNSIVLTGDVVTMVALCRSVSPVERIVLGGLHHKPGRSARLPYVYLTEEELRLLEGLAAEGVRIEAQDLPTSAPVPLAALR